MTISILRLARRCIAHAAAIAALGLPLSAVAADFPVQPGPAAVQRPLWTGFYIGVQGGGGWATSRLVDPHFDISFTAVTISSSGWEAGAQVGADWQFGNMVVGGELDALGASIKGSATNLGGSVGALATGVSQDYRALLTGTGRVGYAAGSYLGYIKAGIAWANIDSQSGIGATGPGVPIDVDHQRTGLTAGGGLEMALIGNLSARLEYDFIYFGTSSINLGSKLPVNVDHQIHLATLGLNWRFSE